MSSWSTTRWGGGQLKPGCQGTQLGTSLEPRRDASLKMGGKQYGGDLQQLWLGLWLKGAEFGNLHHLSIILATLFNHPSIPFSCKIQLIYPCWKYLYISGKQIFLHFNCTTKFKFLSLLKQTSPTDFLLPTADAPVNSRLSSVDGSFLFSSLKLVA